MSALGQYIFGAQEGFVLIIRSDDVKRDDTEIDIDYCPFCGTRLDEVPQIQIDKFTRPKKKRSLRASS